MPDRAVPNNDPHAASLSPDPTNKTPEPTMPQTAATEFLPPTRARLALPLAGLLALAGCGTNSDQKFAPVCPQLKLLADAADLTRTRGQGTDLTDLVLQARITGVAASCSEGSRGSVDAVMKVMIDAARGPAATTRDADLPYLVTVTAGGQPIDQKMFIARATFASNVDRTTVQGEEVTLSFPVSQSRAITDYAIYVSFRLTASELAANRRKK
jgi:hypothetical protein